MNIERALEEHLPTEIELLEKAIQQSESVLAEQRTRMAKLHRIAAAAGVPIEPTTQYREEPGLDLVA